MFQEVLISKDKDENILQRRLYSCLRLVADKTEPVTFYYHDAWLKNDILKQAGVEVNNLTTPLLELLKERDLLPPPYKKDEPSIVYISHEDWNARAKEAKNIPVKSVSNQFIFSNTPLLHRAALELQGLNANTAILCLAAIGLDIILPNVSFDLMADEEIDRIKSMLEEDRTEYLKSISAIADGSYERILSGDFKDVLKWSRNEVFLKLVPKARSIEQGVLKMKTKTLKDAGFSFFKTGIPSIGKAYVESGMIHAGGVASAELLKVICSSLSKGSESRHLPEVSYALKIKEITTF